MVNTAAAIQFLYPESIPVKDWAVKNEDGKETIIRWNEAKLGPKPTKQELEAASVAAAEGQAAKESKRQEEEADLEKVRADNNTSDTVAALVKELDRLKKRVKALEEAAK